MLTLNRLANFFISRFLQCNSSCSHYVCMYIHNENKLLLWDKILSRLCLIIADLYYSSRINVIAINRRIIRLYQDCFN